jgi:hypothetical protein
MSRSWQRAALWIFRAAPAAGLVLMAACSFQSDSDNRALIERYFSLAGANDLDGALKLYSDRFFTSTSRSEWRQVLNGLHERCGAIRAHTLSNWSQLNSFGSAAGSRSVLVYEVSYDRCRVAEAFTVFKPTDGTPAIVGHDIKVNGSSNTPGSETV